MVISIILLFLVYFVYNIIYRVFHVIPTSGIIHMFSEILKNVSDGRIVSRTITWKIISFEDN